MRQAGHQVTRIGDLSTFSSASAVGYGFVHSTGSPDLARVVIPVEQTSRYVFLKLLLPDWRAVNVFEVDSLSVLVLVIFWAIKVLIRQFTQIAQVMSDREGQVLFSGDVTRVFDWKESQWYITCCRSILAYLYRRGYPSAILE